MPDPDDEPLFPGPLFPGPIVPLNPAPPLPPEPPPPLVADSDDDVFPLDSDDEPLFPGPPLNPAPPVPPQVVMMVPLTIVSDASIVAPPPVAPPPFYVPALGSPVPALVESDDELRTKKMCMPTLMPGLLMLNWICRPPIQIS